MLGSWRSLAQSHPFGQASAEQRIMHARLCPSFVYSFLRPEQLLVIGKRAARPLTDCVRIVALKRKDVSQEGFNALVHRFPQVKWAPFEFVQVHCS